MKHNVKILNANKNVRKNFETIEKAQNYIDDMNLYPAKKDVPINLEITHVEYKVINKKFPELSNSIKKQLIQILKDNVNEISTSDMFIPAKLHGIYKYGHKSIYSNILNNFVQNKFNVSDEDMKKYYSKYYWNKTKLVEAAPFAKKLIDDNFLSQHGPKLITKLIDSFSLDDIKFRFIHTNYKPCHNINIDFDGCTFQIRNNDIIFNNGQITGRNVSVNKVSDLTDDKFNEFIKTTKYKILSVFT